MEFRARAKRLSGSLWRTSFCSSFDVFEKKDNSSVKFQCSDKKQVFLSKSSNFSKNMIRRRFFKNVEVNLGWVDFAANGITVRCQSNFRIGSK